VDQFLGPDQFSLTAKPFHDHLVPPAEGRGQHFQGDDGPEFAMDGFEDHPHPTSTDPIEQYVGSDE
jgi:hypothetical protein